MSNNNLSKAVDKGLIKPNQVFQSMVRGSDPIRAFGETEMRVAPMYMDMLEKTPGVSRFSNQGMSINDLDDEQLKILKDVEYRLRKEQLVPTFTVHHNWLAALDKFIGEIQDELIVLPFPQCRFVLQYEAEVRAGYVEQDPDTLKITVTAVTNSDGGLSEELSDVFKRHVAAVCVALEMELAGKIGEVVKDLGKSSVASGVYKEEYKILPITKKSTAGSHNINTGKTKQRFHVRRSHWKTVKGVRKRIKWYFAGNIELGIIVKDYAIE